MHVDLVFVFLFFCACCLSFFPFQRLEFVSFLETFSKSNFVESVTHTHFGRVMGMERREREERVERGWLEKETEDKLTRELVSCGHVQTVQRYDCHFLGCVQLTQVSVEKVRFMFLCFFLHFCILFCFFCDCEREGGSEG